MFQNYSFAIVDFSKNNPYPPATEFLKSIQSRGVDPSRLTVVARNNQKAELQVAVAALRQVKWVDDLSLFHLSLPVPVVKQELAFILKAAPQDAILVTSYNGAVLGEVQQLGYPNVDTQSLGKFRPGVAQLPPRPAVPSLALVDATTFSQLTPPPAKTHWRFDGFIPREEAQVLMLRVLHRYGAVDRRQSVSLQSLKPAIGKIDQRFAGSGYTNGTGGMMGVLASGAHFEGLLDAAASYNGTPYYWLTPRALQQLSVPDTAGTPPTAVEELPAAPITTTAATVARPAASVNAPVEPGEDVNAVVRRARERSPHKSQRMQDALIESGSGPRTKQRIAMLDRIAEILGKRQEDTLTEILDMARDGMLQAVTDGPEKQATVAAIGAVRKMLREYLPASKALKDKDKNPLPEGFRAGPTIVAEFDADWRMRTEAQLLLKLIAVFPEPVDAEHDVENLIGALYHVRNGPDRRDLKRQVEAMISYLLDKGLVHEEPVNGHRTLVLGGPKTTEAPAEGSQLRIAQSG